MKKVLAITTLMLAFAVIAQAGPLDPSQISADAKWFGHVNVAKIRSMDLCKELKKQCESKCPYTEGIGKISQDIGMDPMQDLVSITLYSMQYEGKVGVALFAVKKCDKEKMLAFFKEKYPDHKTVKQGKHKLYSWTAKHGDKEMELTGGFFGDNMIVIGADADHVKAAFDVLDGKKAGMDTDSPLVKDVSKASLFVSRAIDVPEEYRKTTKCPVLRNCTAASVQWSAKGGEIVGKYKLTTDSEETAKNYKAIVDGGKAMAQLRCGEMESAKKLMDGLKYHAKGNTFVLVWKASESDIKEAVGKMMEEKKDKK